jgi:hypothetical protein
MRKVRCIICGQDKDGLDVKDDYVIKAIRAFKRHVTKNERNYRLTVCRECYKNYTKSRDSYVRRMVLYVSIGVIFTLVLTFAAGFRALPVGIFIIVLMYLLSLLSYTPAVILPKVADAGEKKGIVPHKKRV